MTFCVLCAVLVLVLHTQAWKTEYTESGKEEGEECHREAGEVWTCKKHYKCDILESILQVNGRLKTCSWTGDTPILCCPPKKQLERLQVSKSKKRCDEYQDWLCTTFRDAFPFLTKAEPPLSLQRSKRQTFGGWLTYPLFNSAFSIGGYLWSIATGDIASTALIGYGEPNAITWECGGTLISETFVLSAAHCAYTPYGPARWVRLGERDILLDTEEVPHQQMEIVERVVHPGYQPPAFYNDLVLFRLNRSAEFNKFVRPACLHPDLKDPSLLKGSAAGWGKNETNGPKSTSLMVVDVHFIHADTCKLYIGVIDKYLPKGINTDTMICAGDLGKDTCQGDSGGPLLLKFSDDPAGNNCLGKLVGVTSFGPRNCGSDVPSAYVRVAYFISWIESIVWPD